MIYISRSKAPAILQKNAPIWQAAYIKSVDDFNANPTPINKKIKDNAAKHYREKSIQNALKIMFFDKCAYCESKISHISYGTIDHFRPKSLFPAHCFDWNNLLWSCINCNSTYKKDQFPTTPQGDSELINPTEENPADFLIFQFDKQTGTANILSNNSRGEITINTLGLNRPDLVKRRSDFVRGIAILIIIASKGNEEALSLLHKGCAASSEYAAFVRSLLKYKGLQLPLT